MPPPAKAHLDAYVFHADGAPFANGHVVLDGETLRPRSRTDVHGHFVLESVTPGRYELAVEFERAGTPSTTTWVATLEVQPGEHLYAEYFLGAASLGVTLAFQERPPAGRGYAVRLRPVNHAVARGAVTTLIIGEAEARRRALEASVATLRDPARGAEHLDAHDLALARAVEAGELRLDSFDEHLFLRDVQPGWYVLEVELGGLKRTLDGPSVPVQVTREVDLTHAPHVEVQVDVDREAEFERALRALTAGR